jgi:hypothetical protein
MHAAQPAYRYRPWRLNNDQPGTGSARAVEIAFRAWGSCHHASRRTSVGGVVGVFTGVLGVGKSGQAPAAGEAKQDGSAKTGKTAKAAKGGKATKQAVLTQEGEPQLTAEQIVVNSDANIERIKNELKLTPEQEKHWTGFNSAMHYLGHNGADRLNLRIARAKRDPPDDIVEQMRNEAQFLNDRAVDQRNVADAAEPLFASLDDKQKAVFIEEMVRLSHERGLD